MNSVQNLLQAGTGLQGAGSTSDFLGANVDLHQGAVTHSSGMKIFSCLMISRR
jgi:hypothetical protein